jgi:fucose permease
MGEQRRPATASRRSDLLSLGSFVALGLPDGMLGTAWPSMRATFGAPVGDLGLVLLIATAGSVLVTAFVGPLIRRLGVPALLAVAGAVAALGYTGFALAPGLWLVLAVSALLGVAAGLMDAGLNTAVALTGRQRLLNLLHGAYGVGTAIGPLVVTAAILTGSWRPAYLVQLTLDLILAAAWLRQRQRDRAQAGAVAGPPAAAASGPHPAATWSRRRYGGIVAAGMSVFFVYTGLEVGAGQWEASYCRGHLNLSAGATGLAAFGYWGALTAVRIGLAVLPRPVPPQAVVRWGSALAVLAAATIWWQPVTAVAVAGFVVLGGALAGVFPALISLTPVRLGEQRARNVISWQVGAAAAGGAGISAIIGLLIGVTSLAVLGPAVAVLALLLIAAELLLHHLAPLTPPAPLHLSLKVHKCDHLPHRAVFDKSRDDRARSARRLVIEATFTV